MRIVLVIDATTVLTPGSRRRLPDVWANRANPENGYALEPINRTSRSKRYSGMPPCRHNQATQRARIRPGKKSLLISDPRWRIYPIPKRCQTLVDATIESGTGSTRKRQPAALFVRSALCDPTYSSE